MSPTLSLPVARFLHTLEIVAKEGMHLSYSWNGLFNQAIDVEWVDSLEKNPGCAEQLEAFVSRFGRMQDMMADKLFPRWDCLHSLRCPVVKLKHSIALNGTPLGCTRNNI
jgi:hypothetical protein